MLNGLVIAPGTEFNAVRKDGLPVISGGELVGARGAKMLRRRSSFCGTVRKIQLNSSGE